MSEERIRESSSFRLFVHENISKIAPRSINEAAIVTVFKIIFYV